ncbi:MAG: Hsp20/alpha crystallin family protein [Actinomycetia bacterium]|nr:Hsp20/alpha crystallin family protein [Actinomycetes bacterium]
MEPRDKNDPAALRRLQNEVDRMFLELLRGERAPRCGRAAFRPNADVYYDTRAGKVVVRLELPGIDPDAIDLEVDDNMLRVSGVRTDERHPDAVYQQMEIVYGRFERSVMLPPEVDSGKASASYNAGYLEIVLPLKPRSAGRRIRINAKEDAAEGGQER